MTQPKPTMEEIQHLAAFYRRFGPSGTADAFAFLLARVRELENQASIHRGQERILRGAAEEASKQCREIRTQLASALNAKAFFDGFWLNQGVEIESEEHAFALGIQQVTQLAAAQEDSRRWDALQDLNQVAGVTFRLLLGAPSGDPTDVREAIDDFLRPLDPMLDAAREASEDSKNAD